VFSAAGVVNKLQQTLGRYAVNLGQCHFHTIVDSSYNPEVIISVFADISNDA
jgi:hypothetical protein